MLLLTVRGQQAGDMSLRLCRLCSRLIMASARIAGMRLHGSLLTRTGVWSNILSGCQGVSRLLAGDVRDWLVVQMSISLILRGCVWLLDTNVVCVKVTDYFLQTNSLSER